MRRHNIDLVIYDFHNKIFDFHTLMKETTHDVLGRMSVIIAKVLSLFFPLSQVLTPVHSTHSTKTQQTYPFNPSIYLFLVKYLNPISKPLEAIADL